MVHPDWQPRRRRAGHEQPRSGGAEPGNLYAIRPDGSGLHQLTHASVDGHMRIETPRWDPDGSRILVSIVYTTGPDFAFGGEVQLAFVDAAGGEPELISTAERQVSGSATHALTTPAREDGTMISGRTS